MGGLGDVTNYESTTTEVLSTLASIVGKSAPLLGTVIAGPLGGIAVSLIADIFSGHSSDVPALIQKIQADPDAAAKLKKLELDHEENLKKIASTNFQLRLADIEDARKYSTIYHDFLRHMAYLVTLGFFLALCIVFIPVKLDADAKALLSLLIGMLASKWQTIIDFFYGSSTKTKPWNKGGLPNG